MTLRLLDGMVWIIRIIKLILTPPLKLLRNYVVPPLHMQVKKSMRL